MAKIFGKKIVFLLIFLPGVAHALPSEGYYFRNRSVKSLPALYKIPYRSHWVSVIKKGKLFKYKRREFSSPRIDGERIFLGGDHGYFYAMKIRNGRKLWRFKAEGTVNSTPAIGGGKVFFGDDKGNLYALESGSGKFLWKKDLGSEIQAAPLVSGNAVFAATLEGTVAALRGEDGTTLWERPRNAKPLQMTVLGNASPVADDRFLYIGFSNGDFVCLSQKDGHLVWEKNFPATHFADIDGVPLLEGDRIYLATADGPLMALSRRDGKVLWSKPIGTAVAFAATSEVLYVAGFRGAVHAVRKSDGTILWELSVGDGALTAPVIYKDVLAIGLSSATMNFIDLHRGKLMYRRFARKGISSDPIIEGNYLYYFSNGGRLYSLKLVN